MQSDCMMSTTLLTKGGFLTVWLSFYKSAIISSPILAWTGQTSFSEIGMKPWNVIFPCFPFGDNHPLKCYNLTFFTFTTVKLHFQILSSNAGTWNSLVKMSNSKIETWSLQVRSTVDFRAMASIPSSKLWTFFKCCLNKLHLTMHLNVKNIKEREKHTNICIAYNTYKKKQKKKELFISHTFESNLYNLYRIYGYIHPLVSKYLPPELSCLCLGQFVGITMKLATWKYSP